MFGIAFLAVLVVAGFGALLVGLALIVGLVHLVLRVALLPVVVGFGVLKLLVLPIVGLVLLALLAAVAPVVLVAVVVLAVPAAAIALLGCIAWGGLRLIAAV